MTMPVHVRKYFSAICVCSRLAEERRAIKRPAPQPKARMEMDEFWAGDAKQPRKDSAFK
jgi:hypothetical protein